MNMKESKRAAVDAFGQFTAAYLSCGREDDAARFWKSVKAYIDAEADRVAATDPPLIDRAAVVLVNEADSLLRMMTSSRADGHMSDLENDIWDTVFRFREKTCMAEVDEACEKYCE